MPNLYVGDEIKTYVVETPKGSLQITALPWPRRSMLFSREDTRSLSVEEVNERIQDLFTRAIQQAAERLDPEIPAILTGHITVSGATLGSERSMMLGQDHFLLPSSIHLPAFDYIALGHIHKHQVLRENPLMVYSGSLQRVDFGEEKDPKGFCVIDLDPSRIQGRRLVDFRFQQVNARNFTTIDVNVPKESRNPTQDILHAIDRHNVSGAIVRLRISLTAEQSTILRDGDAAIRDALKDAHYIASINKQVAEERRSRLPPDTVNGLGPLKALALYLQSRETRPQRQEKLLQYARRLVEEEESDQEMGQVSLLKSDNER